MTPRLQETQSSLHLTQQECSQISTIRSQLQLELHQLSQEFQHKETLLQTALTETATTGKQLESCQGELEAVKEELKNVCGQRDEAYHELEEVKGQMVGVAAASLWSSYPDLLCANKKQLSSLSHSLYATNQLTDSPKCFSLHCYSNSLSQMSVSLVSTDQDSTLSADPTPQQTAASDGSHDMEGLTLTRTGLENRVAELEQEMRDKAGQYQQQVWEE